MTDHTINLAVLIVAIATLVLTGVGVVYSRRSKEIAEDALNRMKEEALARSLRGEEEAVLRLAFDTPGESFVQIRTLISSSHDLLVFHGGRGGWYVLPEATLIRLENLGHVERFGDGSWTPVNGVTHGGRKYRLTPQGRDHASRVPGPLVEEHLIPRQLSLSDWESKNFGRFLQD